MNNHKLYIMIGHSLVRVESRIKKFTPHCVCRPRLMLRSQHSEFSIRENETDDSQSSMCLEVHIARSFAKQARQSQKFTPRPFLSKWRKIWI